MVYMIYMCLPVCVQAGYGDLCAIRDGEERLRERLERLGKAGAMEREVRQMVSCALLAALQLPDPTLLDTQNLSASELSGMKELVTCQGKAAMSAALAAKVSCKSTEQIILKCVCITQTCSVFDTEV